jgi:hypothetical protein
LSLSPHSSGFVPAQTDFELRVPARFSAGTLNGRELALAPARVLDEGRDRRFAAVRIPLAESEVVLR